jgi:hypothetical protein
VHTTCCCVAARCTTLAGLVTLFCAIALTTEIELLLVLSEAVLHATIEALSCPTSSLSNCMRFILQSVISVNIVSNIFSLATGNVSCLQAEKFTWKIAEYSYCSSHLWLLLMSGELVCAVRVSYPSLVGQNPYGAFYNSISYSRMQSIPLSIFSTSCSESHFVNLSVRSPL